MTPNLLRSKQLKAQMLISVKPQYRNSHRPIKNATILSIALAIVPLGAAAIETERKDCTWGLKGGCNAGWVSQKSSDGYICYRAWYSGKFVKTNVRILQHQANPPYPSIGFDILRDGNERCIKTAKAEGTAIQAECRPDNTLHTKGFCVISNTVGGTK
jgi:hypothetical protein